MEPEVSGEQRSNAPGMRRGNGRTARRLTLTVVVFLFAALLVMKWRAEENPADRASVADWGNRPESLVVDSADAQVVEGERSDTADVTVPADADAEPDVIDDGRLRTIFVQFEDQSGKPWANFDFAWSEVTTAQRRDLLSEPDAVSFTPDRFDSADDQGRWRVSARPGSRIVIVASQQSCVSLERPQEPMAILLQKWGAHCIAVTTQLADEATVRSRWGTSLTVYVKCLYADGQPFAGQVGWGLHEMGAGNAIHVTSQGSFVECPPLLEVDAAVGTNLAVSVRGMRVGFKAAARAEFDITPASHLQTFLVTIPFDHGRDSIKVIEVDCSALPVQSKVIVHVLNVFGMSVDRQRVSGPKVVTSGDLTKSGDEFVVQVSGDHLWLSERIRVPDGETRRVKLEVVATGSVKARVVDTDGIAIPGARMLPEVLKGRAWDRAGPVGGGASKDDPFVAYSDAAGNVLLQNIPVGEVLISVEASTYQATVRETVVPFGGVVDIGDVVLQLETGSGRFTLIVAEGDDPTKYYLRVYILGDGGNVVKGRAPYFGADGVLELQNLPPGTFGVLVKRGSEQGLWTKKFEITPNEQTDITIDTTLPKGSQTGK